VLKLSKLTDYGTLLMTTLAAAPESVRNAQELATETHVSAPTVAKLLKLLVRGGLVESTRGAHGGYRLARAPEKITVAEVVRALEGPIALTACSVHGGGCGIEESCAARVNWRVINDAVKQALDGVTLAEMAAPLRSLLRTRAAIQPPPLNEFPLTRF